MNVVFSSRAYIAVLAETLSNINTETGGVFLGKYLDGVWYIIESIDPGPNSTFKVDYFEYDRKYVQHLINKKALLYETNLELIGLWHRHPGSFDKFSGTDDKTNTQYAAMRKQGAISMLVNLEPEFRFTIYHVAQPCIYHKLESYDVGDKYFPNNLLSYKDPMVLKSRLNGDVSHNTSETVIKKNLDDIMSIIIPTLVEKYTYTPKFELFNIPKKEDFSQILANEVASDLLFIGDRYGISFVPTISENKLSISQECKNRTCVLSFTYVKKEAIFLFTYLNNTYHYRDGLFRDLIREALQDGL